MKLGIDNQWSRFINKHKKNTHYKIIKTKKTKCNETQ